MSVCTLLRSIVAWLVQKNVWVEKKHFLALVANNDGRVCYSKLIMKPVVYNISERSHHIDFHNLLIFVNAEVSRIELHLLFIFCAKVDYVSVIKYPR